MSKALCQSFIRFYNQELTNFVYTVKMNMLYLINKIVATDYKQYYLLKCEQIRIE